MNTLTCLDLYQTKQHMYITGQLYKRSDCYRILKIDRSSVDQHVVTVDNTEYSRVEIDSLLQMIDDGNKSQGGLKSVLRGCYGLVGFVKFNLLYLYIISKASEIACINGHYVYQIEQVRLIPVTNVNFSANAQLSQELQQLKRSDDELRKIDLLSSVDLTKHCYFSYTCDLTHTFQNLLTADRPQQIRDKYMWNYFLCSNGFSLDQIKYGNCWVLPIIHGFVESANVNQSLNITLIARRSRHYAGVRYMRRGIDDNGNVANEVETEQILQDQFYLSSHVQIRGSIPVHWQQEVNNLVPKPPITIHFVDPYYRSTLKHFSQLRSYYGASGITVLNLVKHNDLRRETILLGAFNAAISFVNQFLPSGERINYIAFDMAKASKQSKQNWQTAQQQRAKSRSSDEGTFLPNKTNKNDVISILERITADSVQQTGLFCIKKCSGEILQVQRGIIRTNCIDCLDRTNAAQFIIGKLALCRQLNSMKLSSKSYLTFDNDSVKLLMRMCNDMGNVIALQYGGSALVNTMETYRRKNAAARSRASSASDGNTQEDDEMEYGGMGNVFNQRLQSYLYSSRDMLETIKRYYSNSFTDAEKQEAINLFIGYDSQNSNYVHVNSTSVESLIKSFQELPRLSESNNSQESEEHTERDSTVSAQTSSESLLVSLQDCIEYKLLERASAEGRMQQDVVLQSPVTVLSRKKSSPLMLSGGTELNTSESMNNYSSQNGKYNKSSDWSEFIDVKNDFKLKDLSEKEIDEYQRYVDQFKGDKFESDDNLQQYNYDYYAQYVKMELKPVSKEDMQIFSDYVNFTKVLEA
ncbi:hypothetical protein MP228_006634 [Amoeboaphelidium protococcarum]|nr:hypothetical protein MP228_006634 [Amoeboaphelidium protococcarum]